MYFWERERDVREGHAINHPILFNEPQTFLWKYHLKCFLKQFSKKRFEKLFKNLQNDLQNVTGYSDTCNNVWNILQIIRLVKKVLKVYLNKLSSSMLFKPPFRMLVKMPFEKNCKLPWEIGVLVKLSFQRDFLTRSLFIGFLSRVIFQCFFGNTSWILALVKFMKRFKLSSVFHINCLLFSFGYQKGWEKWNNISLKWPASNWTQ